MSVFERCFVVGRQTTSQPIFGDRNLNPCVRQLLLRTALHSSQRWLLEVPQREPLVAKGWVRSRLLSEQVLF